VKVAVYPGSFDPVTYGHLDIIKRASQMFDKVIVAVMCNSAKTPLFTLDERVKMIRESVSGLNNVYVESFSGLLIDYCKKENIHIVIRGLRAITDFEYELQMAQTNRVLAPDIDTVFMTTSLEYAYLSSTIMKEVALFGGDISRFAPPATLKAVREKLACKAK
jgi:pantetheine-phosphate adenylyltransferase